MKTCLAQRGAKARKDERRAAPHARHAVLKHGAHVADAAQHVVAGGDNVHERLRRKAVAAHGEEAQEESHQRRAVLLLQPQVLALDQPLHRGGEVRGRLVPGAPVGALRHQHLELHHGRPAGHVGRSLQARALLGRHATPRGHARPRPKRAIARQQRVQHDGPLVRVVNAANLQEAGGGGGGARVAARGLARRRAPPLRRALLRAGVQARAESLGAVAARGFKGRRAAGRVRGRGYRAAAAAAAAVQARAQLRHHVVAVIRAHRRHQRDVGRQDGGQPSPHAAAAAAGVTQLVQRVERDAQRALRAGALAHQLHPVLGEGLERLGVLAVPPVRARDLLAHALQQRLGGGGGRACAAEADHGDGAWPRAVQRGGRHQARLSDAAAAEQAAGPARGDGLGGVEHGHRRRAQRSAAHEDADLEGKGRGGGGGHPGERPGDFFFNHGAAGSLSPPSLLALSLAATFSHATADDVLTFLKATRPCAAASRSTSSSASRADAAASALAASTAYSSADMRRT